MCVGTCLYRAFLGEYATGTTCGSQQHSETWDDLLISDRIYRIYIHTTGQINCAILSHLPASKSWNTLWERDERSLHLVAATVRDSLAWQCRRGTNKVKFNFDMRDEQIKHMHDLFEDAVHLWY